MLVVRQCMAIRKEKRGNAAVQSAPCLTGELLMLRDEGGGGVPLRRGRWQLSGGRRSQISASVHQSRERRWAGNTPKYQ